MKEYKLFSCKFCGTEIKDKYEQRVYCSHSCRIKYQIKIGHFGRLGKIPWNKGISTGIKPWLGKKRSLETIEKFRKSHMGKKHSLEECKKISIANRGEKHYNWKGGITQLDKRIRKINIYCQWRTKIFERDNYTCQECGKRNCYLEAHHIKQFALLLKEFNIHSIETAENCKELWELDNGKTLCVACHNLTKRRRNDV
jgi:hypothetical protein